MNVLLATYLKKWKTIFQPWDFNILNLYLFTNEFRIKFEYGIFVLALLKLLIIQIRTAGSLAENFGILKSIRNSL